MTHKNQGGVEVPVVLLDIVRIMLGCLPLVHRIEVETGVISLDGLKERSESILETTLIQRSATQPTSYAELTTSDRFVVAESPFRRCPP